MYIQGTFWLGQAVCDIVHNLEKRQKTWKTTTVEVKLCINLFNLHVHCLTSSWWSQKKKNNLCTQQNFP